MYKVENEICHPSHLHFPALAAAVNSLELGSYLTKLSRLLILFILK